MLAARHLQRLGYRVVARNVASKLGELDLVAREKSEYVFVEVKTRVGARGITPEDNVTRQKVTRLTRLAEAYLAAHSLEGAMWRIDVVAVVLDRAGDVIRLEHYKNAVN